MLKPDKQPNMDPGADSKDWLLDQDRNAALSRAMQSELQRIRAKWGEDLAQAQPEWYGSLPQDELDAVVGKSLEVFAQCLKRSTLDPLRDYLDQSSVAKLDKGISINDMVEGMLLGKEAIWTYVQQSGESGRSRFELRTPLENFFRNAMALVAKNYADLTKERLTRQSDKLAVQAERQRLARDLHDSVTQSLYSIGLYADAARRALESGKQDTAANHLLELKAMSREAMVDMRALVFELHPPELESQGLVGALQARLNAVELRAGMKAELKVEGDPLPMTLPQCEDLFRIALEALNNVLKHANTDHVEIVMEYASSCLTLSIVDLGAGFDPGRTNHGGWGLKGMRDRARRLGTDLLVDSAPGQGCRIGLVLDLPQGNA